MAHFSTPKKRIFNKLKLIKQVIKNLYKKKNKYIKLIGKFVLID